MTDPQPHADTLLGWRASQGDATNQARATLPGRIRTRPRQRWSLDTGGDVHAARCISVSGEPWVVAIAGTVLQAAPAAGGTGWSLPRRPVGRLISAGDLDGTGRGCILVRGTQRELLLIEAATGAIRWRWSSPEGTFINEAGAVLLVPIARGHRLIVAPIYATHLVAFDLVGDGPPVERWRLEGSWDAGFGPSLVAADMDGRGTLSLALSSRLGSSDRTRGGVSTSSELVLGRRRGSLYQGIVELSTGQMTASVAWTPNGRGYRCARPYGLFAAAPMRPGELPALVLVCCQVEEYLAVTRRARDGSLRRGWGHFVEKDWPVDAQELRAHPDSLRDIDGDDRPELSVSLWDGQAWSTIVLDPAVGIAQPITRIPDRLLWGSLARSGVPSALLVSAAISRRVHGPVPLELLDGRTFEVIDRIPAATVVVGRDEDLPGDRAFMAERRGLTRLHTFEDGEAAVVRLPDGTLRAWSVDAAGRRRLERLGGSGTTAVLGGPGAPLLVDQSGRIDILTRKDGPGRPGWRARRGLRAVGRTVQPLVRTTGSGPQLVLSMSDATVLGGRPVGRGQLADAWRVAGVHPSPVRDTASGAELLHVGSTVDDPPGSRIHVGDRPGSTPQVRIMLGSPLDRACLALPDGALVLTLRTGTHTLVTEVREPDGTLRWRAGTGAYLHPPGIGDHHGRPVVVLDDHGILRCFDAVMALGASHHAEDGSGRAHRPRWERDWTAAYSMPITGPFLEGGLPGVLRANGIHGLELLDAHGARRWRTAAPLWQYAAGRAAVARLSDGRALVAHPRRDGRIDGIEVATGAVLWTLSVSADLEHAALAVADIDGDGRDELLVGLPDGRLVCLQGLDGPVRELWTFDAGAGVTALAIADMSGDGHADVVIGTSDGKVRILR